VVCGHAAADRRSSTNCARRRSIVKRDAAQQKIPGLTIPPWPSPEAGCDMAGFAHRAGTFHQTRRGPYVLTAYIERLAPVHHFRECHMILFSPAALTFSESRITRSREAATVHSVCQIAFAKWANWFSPDPQWNGIRTGETYRFRTGQAFLLVKTRFLSPRNERG
jgi:hypothetical protein